MDWLERCGEALLEGSSVNVVGLSGSGRSRSLGLLSDWLLDQGWACELWTIDDLRCMERRAMKAAVDRLRMSGSLAVLLIDDFGDFLVEGEGPWLERMLFTAVHEAPDDGGEFLRCVLVTYPRDREVVGPGSLLRERAQSFPPAPPEPGESALALWGVSSTTELDHVIGCATSLDGIGGDNPAQRRGNAMRVARDELPKLVGQLDGAQQKRLGTILSRSTPARWRPDESDPVLRPLVVPSASEQGDVCHVPEIIDQQELVPLLLTSRWPERAPRASAARFVARCGNEPEPLWVDNYLSDLQRLDATRLSGFIQEVIARLPSESRLRVLSRNFVDGQRISTGDIQGALLGAGLPPEVQQRLEWRLYDQYQTSNLHRRELILARRGVGFALPIATMLVGQSDLGNESDAELALPDFAPVQQAWASASAIQWFN